ncbi:MAG: sugar nucleotide-binding protein, partial [Rhodobacteraceae bacterium]|nr:sugar nucleotide-binding protein [Paracoccaceae bacterium]
NLVGILNQSGKQTFDAVQAAGEAAARAAFPDAVILRPSIVFGTEDQFFNRFAGMARLSPAIPVVGAGTEFQPVYVDDVAQAIFQAAARPEAAGQTYELGGPKTYSFAGLMRLMLATIHRRRFLAPLPFPVARLQAWGLDLAQTVTFGLFTNTLLTRDQVKLLRRNNVVSEGALGLKDLGVEATTLESVLPSYLYRFRPYGQYDRSVTMA